MKAHIEAIRGIAYLNGEAVDLAKVHPDAAVRAAAQERAEILTPITKGWGTDLGVEMTSIAIQVHGGMGYIEETGVAQHYRDARIAPIYEGTNGIQAMDLVGRKLGLRGGAAIAEFVDGIAAHGRGGERRRRRAGRARHRPRPTASPCCARPPRGCSPTRPPTPTTRSPAPRRTSGSPGS